MITKENVETILKINGLSPTAPDEQIRSVLLSANFNQEETEMALAVLRENTRTKQTRIDGLHKIFRTDIALKPEEISSLLGIDVDVSDIDSDQQRRLPQRLTVAHLVVIWFLAVVIAVTGILFYMYVNEVGLFHPSLTVNS